MRVELRCGHFALLVFIYLQGGFHDFEDALLGERGREDDGEVGEWRKALAYGGLIGLDVIGGLVFHQIPLVDANHEALFVALYKLEYVEVLRLDAARGVNHQDTNVAVLNGAYAAYNGVILKVFVYFGFFPDACRVHEVEVAPEFVVARIYAVARGAGYVSNHGALLAYEGVEYG